MKKRERRETDQEDMQKAYEMLNELINSHTEIEGTLWYAACWATFVSAYANAGGSYDDFFQEVQGLLPHFKEGFDR